MKLYTFDAAPSPRRLGLFMQYKGIEIETRQVDMMAGEQLAPEYKAINPQCTVPALVLDDGTVLSEVIGICTYLEALHPDKPLFGTTPLEKALVASWIHKIFNSLMMGVAEALRNASPGFVNRALPGPLDVPQIPELAERGKMRLEHGWKAMDSELAGVQWLAGDSFSQADIDLLVCSEFSGWVKCAPGEELANVQALLGRISSELSLD